MAAVVMAMKHKRDGEQADGDGRPATADGPTKGASQASLGQDYSRADMDENRDGRLSVEELLRHLPHVSIRADLMLQRLHLEMKMTTMMMKLPIFLTCLICFLVALGNFSPAASVSKVHKHLETHFELSKAKGLTTYEGIYDYIETFEKKNEELQASSAKYWCEQRFYSAGWNSELMVPYSMCQSPRLQALGVGDKSSQLKWTAWNASGGCPGSNSGSSSGDCAGAGEDLLTSAVSAEMNDVKVLNQYPECMDNDTSLAMAEGDPNATCADAAPAVCENEAGILFCPKTCNYCAPFRYNRMAKFPKPQLTLLPIVVYQTRFQLGDCHGFAKDYIKQPINPVLSVLPALDGLKSDKLIECIDRSKTYKGDYAIEKECVANSSILCQPCSYDPNVTCVLDTPKADFHGTTVYPMVITEPHHDVMRMKSLNWLDLQTDTVSVSTVIYTEGVEIFTSLTVDFSIDEAGNVVEHHKMMSYRDLTEGSKTAFIACLIVCGLGAGVGVGFSMYYISQNRKDFKPGLIWYELFSRCVFFIYPFVLLFTWVAQTPMSEEYMKLLMAFLEAPSLEPQSLLQILNKYFEAKSHIYDETSWLKRHRVTANIVLYIQFLQLIFYFSVHPKMAMLTETIWKALTNIIHFLTLFTVLFFMLAYMAHWQLGEFITHFATFGDAISAQGRMIFGEFIYADGAERLHGVMMFMYWLYAFTFMLIMWGLLLNFFLAIVVDAFADVNQRANESEVVGNFFYDVFDVFKSFMDGIKHNWPTRDQLFGFFLFVEQRSKSKEDWFSMLEDEHLGFQGHEHDPLPTCIHEEIHVAFPNEFRHPHQMAVFVNHYFLKIPKLLRRRMAYYPPEAKMERPPLGPHGPPPHGAHQAYPSTPIKPMAAIQMTPGPGPMGTPSPPKEPKDPVHAPMLAPSPLPGAIQEGAPTGDALRDAGAGEAAGGAEGDIQQQIRQVLNMNMELMRHNQEVEARRAEMEEWC